MKYLETILAFLTSLVRIIFPRKQKSAVGDCPCPHPYLDTSYLIVLNLLPVLDTGTIHC